MKKQVSLTVLAVATFLMSFAPAAETATWSLDKAHARLGFAVSHMLVSDTEGSFKKFDATITGTKDDFSDAVVELSADVNSVTTDNDNRDNHIKGPDYFNVAQYSTLTYKSTSFTKVADKKYKISGNLTMRGVTKPVELEATLALGTNPMSKAAIAGFKVSGVVKRKDFGVGSNIPASIVGDEVTLTANVEFNKK